jgi:malonyl-CoA O-methyltransferase/biotin synthesis protein BioG
MQSVWQLNNRRELLLFFSGWGMDARPTAHLNAGRFDVCTCFDYNTLDTEEATRWTRYDRVTLAAWSMGVWAAEQVLEGINIPVALSVAINGTPKPVDDALGIPVATAQATLDGLTPEALRRFYRRMFGSGNLLKERESAGALPAIDFDERREELRRILARRPYPDTGFVWNNALISKEDAIFPPENLQAAWRGKVRIVELDAPHHPFHLFRSWEEIVDA